MYNLSARWVDFLDRSAENERHMVYTTQGAEIAQTDKQDLIEIDADDAWKKKPANQQSRLDILWLGAFLTDIANAVLRDIRTRNGGSGSSSCCLRRITTDFYNFDKMNNCHHIDKSRW